MIQLLCLLLIVYCNANISLWKAEIEQSLNKGLFKCDWSVRNEGKNKGFIVDILYPTQQNVSTIASLPNTLTKTNKEFADIAAKRGFTHSKWGSVQGYRWAIPRNHVGQNRSHCIAMLELTRDDHALLDYYSSYKTIERAFYTVTAYDVVVHPSGILALQCGYYFGGDDGCEQRWNHVKHWYIPCKKALKNAGLSWDDYWSNKTIANGTSVMPNPYSHPLEKCKDSSDLGSRNLKDFPVTKVDKVFTIAALWDYNYHHFMIESLARLCHHLPFLLTHTDILIHIRTFETYELQRRKNAALRVTVPRMRNELFELLGINVSRIASGALYANEAIIPRFTRCSYAISNSIEVRLLADQLLNASNHYIQRSKIVIPQPIKKTIIIQQRYIEGTSNDRAWNNSFTSQIKTSLQENFPQHNVVILSSVDSQRDDYCLACEYIQYSQADILVGAHGAGLTNMMFMPVNSLIVEVVGAFKDVNMPVCGYYNSFAAIFGHHHYLYSYDHKRQQMDTYELSGQVFAFYKQLRENISQSSMRIKTVVNSRQGY